MATYKKTVKKYSNKKNKSSQKTQNHLSTDNKTKQILKNNKNNYSTGNKVQDIIINDKKIKKESKPQSNSDKNEKQTQENTNQIQHNSNLHESQDHNILYYNKDKIYSLTYCVIAAIITVVAVLVIKNNIFNKIITTTTPDLWLIDRWAAVSFFFLFYACALIAVSLLTLSNKTDNNAYEVDIVLYTILLILCFTISLLLFNFDLYLPSAILSMITSALSIFMCYRYYISFFWSGITQTISTLFLLYSTYVCFALSL